MGKRSTHPTEAIFLEEPRSSCCNGTPLQHWHGCCGPDSCLHHDSRDGPLDETTRRKAFGLSAEFAEKTKTLGANQGLYNGFLAAGLSWSIVHPTPEFSKQLQHFFLGCVLVAGTFGAATASRKILFVQAIPALVVLGFVQLGI